MRRKGQGGIGRRPAPLRRKTEQTDRLGRIQRNAKTLLEEIAHQILAFCIARIRLTLAGFVGVGMFATPLGSLGSRKIRRRRTRDNKNE